MKNEYRIKIEGKLTKVNSKEEYEEFKTKYNDYEFMMTNRINEVEAIKKTNKPQKQIKGMPEWFRMWSENVYSNDILKINNRIDGLERRIGELEHRMDGLENKIDTIVKLNSLRTVS